MYKLLVKIILLFPILVTPAQAMLTNTIKSFANKNTNSKISDILGLKKPQINSLDYFVELACKKLRKLPHCDPELGSSWGACHVTAATSMVDFALFNKGERPESLIIRFLLNVDKEGSSPAGNQIYERIIDLGLDKLMLENFSKNKAKKLIKSLQEWLKNDMAQKISIELALNKIKDQNESYIESINILKTYKTKMALVIYPGTPTLSEVRSLIGAEHFIPFTYCDQKESYKLDTNNQYLHFCSSARKDKNYTYARTVSEEQYQDGLKTNMVRWQFGDYEPIEVDLHIVGRSHCVNTPNEDDSYFLLHIGLSEITSNKFERFTMVSHLGLIDFDPIQYMIEQFAIINKNTPDSLPFSDLSLFHFSYLPAYKNIAHLKLPNEILRRAPYEYYHGLPPRKIEHHPFLIYENTNKHSLYSDDNPFELGTSIYKVEKYIRFVLRLVYDNNSTINPEKSYITVDSWNDNHAEWSQIEGDFDEIQDQALKLKLAKHFIESLKKYHEIGFCLRTRVKLNKNGLNLTQLDNIKNSLDTWLR